MTSFQDISLPSTCTIGANETFIPEDGSEEIRQHEQKQCVRVISEIGSRKPVEISTDGGKIEGVVLRIVDADAKWLEHRVKVVRPDFVCGITGHWTRRAIVKQIINPSFAEKYCSTEDYSLAPSLPLLPPFSKDPKNTTDGKGVDLLSNQGGMHILSLGAGPKKTRTIGSSCELSRDSASTGDKPVSATFPSCPPKAQPECSSKRNAKANGKSVPTPSDSGEETYRDASCAWGCPEAASRPLRTVSPRRFPTKPVVGWLVGYQSGPTREEGMREACGNQPSQGHPSDPRPMQSNGLRAGSMARVDALATRDELSLLYFSADASVCTRRVAERETHETIPKGRGERIVSSMAKKLEPPTAEERKRFGSIHFVRTFDDAENLPRSFGARA
eukprot:CAMPEP_0172372482 /NCGR_PEP_ID=MMETSP1060-20121228/47901_1 /TAXON_ID=37318 /ORGANISM="Pseudo-nitzschia pungens, Strain cf. cingulata" /LENGTH=387 /DNA_ID=CAMNT_0013098511 /DNA_START=1808 /DNA_END=2974 /DNA_ORIENTATION=+